MKTVHVIGATGHIGSYLCPHLMQAGYKVTGYSRGLTQPYASFEQKYLDCLVTADREQAIDMAVEAGADVICDLIPYTEGDAQYLCERILNSTKKKDTRVISIGSIWIYGNKVNHMLTEDDPRNAVDDYGKNKALIEKYLLKQYLEQGLRVTVLHPGHICGKGWIPVGPQGNRDIRVLSEIKKGNRIILPDDGQATLHHVHSLDIARMILRSIECDAAVGEAFHIVCEKPISLREYAEMLYRHYGREVNIEYLGYKDFLLSLDEEDAVVSAEHIDRSPNISMEKAREVLGFESIYSEEDTLLEAIDSIFK